MIKKIIAKLTDKQLDEALASRGFWLQIDETWFEYVGNGMMRDARGVAFDVPINKVRLVSIGKPALPHSDGKYLHYTTEQKRIIMRDSRYYFLEAIGEKSCANQ